MTSTPILPSCHESIPRLSPAMARERKARILLRKVDIALKDDGIEAAMKELMRVRLKCPMNTVIRGWVRDYQDTLMVWHADLMPEVVDVFQTYGFRRARNTLSDCMSRITHPRALTLYVACDRTLEQMAERFRLSIRDTETSAVISPPESMSLEDADPDQLENGTKY